MKIKGKLHSGKLAVARDSQYLTLCIALPVGYTNSRELAEWKRLLSSASLKSPGQEHDVDVKIDFSSEPPPQNRRVDKPDDEGELSDKAPAAAKAA